MLGLSTLVPLVLWALGLSFVITVSTIGRPIRTVGWYVLRYVKLDPLVRCPYCNAWWCGLVLAILFECNGWQALQAAFTTCVVSAVIQAQWALAANEDFEGRQSNQEEVTTNDGTEEETS